MLSDKIEGDAALPIHGFLVGVEIEEGVEVESVMRAVAEALYTFKGVGTIDIEHMGLIETIEDVGVVVNDVPIEMTGMKES